MYYVYVLESQEDKSLYIGYSADLKQRLVDHQDGKGARTTRLKKKWELIYFEGYRIKEDALGREKFLKGGSGRKYIKKQLSNYLAIQAAQKLDTISYKVYTVLYNDDVPCERIFISVKN